MAIEVVTTPDLGGFNEDTAIIARALLDMSLTSDDLGGLTVISPLSNPGDMGLAVLLAGAEWSPKDVDVIIIHYHLVKIEWHERRFRDGFWFVPHSLVKGSSFKYHWNYRNTKGVFCNDVLNLVARWLANVALGKENLSCITELAD